MKIKCYFNKNLKMSPQKLAAQVGHVCKELSRVHQISTPQEDVIVVLEASANKFNELLYLMTYYDHYYVQVDNGLTEVPEGTMTVLGWIEED